MKKLLLSGFAFAILHTGALSGQTFTGTWQGALKAPQARNGELRTVIEISTNDADKLAAVFYSIDQGARPITATSVTANGSTWSPMRANGGQSRTGLPARFRF